MGFNNLDTLTGVTQLSVREQAAVDLLVPSSGNPELDSMIADARKFKLACAAMTGLAHQYPSRFTNSLSTVIVSHVTELMKELDK